MGGDMSGAAARTGDLKNEQIEKCIKKGTWGIA